MEPMHIDRVRLDSDLVYRVEYLNSFLGFSEKDKQCIKDSADLVQPLIPDIVDRLYEKLFSYDISKTALLKAFFEFKSNENQTLELDSDAVHSHKAVLIEYFNKILIAEWDTAHIKYLDWVAKSILSISNDNGDGNNDYIFLNSILGFLAGIFTDSLSNISDWDSETKINNIVAFNKLFYVQSDFFSKYFITKKDSESLKSKVCYKKKEILAIKDSYFSQNVSTLILSVAVGVALGSILAFKSNN
ncbi:hypothetical protein BB561_006534 [Smittium simulii]|uniref:Globin-sensor domain-containing protein n=1 Tax=Smittium simulii TaxID=133385 RepID=A0A2T9Y393_9FUNG|nr:hypothetical protein BB561_006534 [Smittium simulii]